MLPPTLRAVPWLCLALLSAPLRAEDAAPAGAYTLKVWETDDGLPHNSIAGVVQRRDGFLWIATQGGLVRFDGLQFTPLRSPLIEGAKSASVIALAEEDADTLLVATVQSGLLRLRAGQLAPHPLGDGTSQRRIANLFHEADGVFWIVFNDREAWRCHGNTTERFAAVPTTRPFWPVSFARAPDGTVYLARGAGLERYAAGKLQLVAQTPTTAIAIATSAKDGIWVATGRRLAKLVDGKFTPVARPPWSGGMPPSMLFEDRDGALWLAAGEQGLLRWQDGATTTIATSHVRIASFTEDDEGNLWIATSGGGLNRLQRTRLTLVADEPDWTDSNSGAVTEDVSGNLWFANRHVIRKINGARVDEIADAGWPKRAMPICADRAGNLWCAVGGDLYRGKCDGSEAPAFMGTSKAGAVHAIFPARDGSVWIGRNAGPLQHYRRDGTVQNVDTAQGYAGKCVRAIGEDVTGHLWVGMEDGRLFEGDGERFTERHAQGELASRAIRAIHGDADGNLWLGTAGGGVVVRRDGRLTRISTAQGLPDEVISQILEDDFGWLWFGSRRGIFKVLKSDLLECADGKHATITPVSFGRADGLSGISAVGSYQPTAWKTAAGKLWFVTRKGLVTTDPAQHENDRRLPRVYLDRVLVDGRAIDLAKPQLTSAARKLELQFTAPTFLAPERVRFRYKLDGLDADWVDVGTQRFATYPALAPGRYHFTVDASNGDLAWNPAGATLDFVVLPQWWETWWARLLAGSVFAVGLVALVHALSQRRLKAHLARLAQEQRLERERVRIARDLHDDLGASLTHASMLAEELAEDWPDLPDPKARSSQLAARVRTISRDLDAVVWAVSPQHDTLASLSAYLSHYAAEYFRHTPIECRAHADDDIPAAPLSPEIRHHLFLIAKELFNNVLKHSQARHVDVSLQMAGDFFELVVTDNGRGFSLAAAAQSERNGLRNLQARAREAGGSLDIDSSPAGTIAVLQFRALVPARATV